MRRAFWFGWSSGFIGGIVGFYIGFHIIGGA